MSLNFNIASELCLSPSCFCGPLPGVTPNTSAPCTPACASPRLPVPAGLLEDHPGSSLPRPRSWAGHRHPHRPTQDLLPLSESHCYCFVLSLRESDPYHLTCFFSVSLGLTWSFPLHHKSTLGPNRVFREKPLCETEAFNLCSFHKIPWSGKNPPYGHT